MTVKEKYQSVLSLGEKMNVQNGRVEEDGNVLRVWGTVESKPTTKVILPIRYHLRTFAKNEV